MTGEILVRKGDGKWRCCRAKPIKDRSSPGIRPNVTRSLPYRTRSSHILDIYPGRRRHPRTTVEVWRKARGRHTRLRLVSRYSRCRGSPTGAPRPLCGLVEAAIGCRSRREAPRGALIGLAAETGAGVCLDSVSPPSPQLARCC